MNNLGARGLYTAYGTDKLLNVISTFVLTSTHLFIISTDVNLCQVYNLNLNNAGHCVKGFAQLLNPHFIHHHGTPQTSN